MLIKLGRPGRKRIHLGVNGCERQVAHASHLGCKPAELFDTDVRIVQFEDLYMHSTLRSNYSLVQPFVIHIPDLEFQ